MAKVKLEALKVRNHPRGDIFEAHENEARVLVLAGLARPAPATAPLTASPSPDAQPTTLPPPSGRGSRGRYARRDMVAVAVSDEDA